MQKLEIRIGDSVFEATFLEKLAPVTCATLLKYLPYEGQGTHASWSGDCIFVLWKTERIPPENTTIYGSPGDVAWNSTDNDEIFINHGVSQYRWRNGLQVANVFAKITDNLDQLNVVCSEIQQKGSKKVTLRRS